MSNIDAEAEPMLEVTVIRRCGKVETHFTEPGVLTSDELKEFMESLTPIP